MLPMASNGSTIIYTRIIKPFVAKHEKTIDDALSAGKQLAKEAGKEGEPCPEQSLYALADS